MRSWLFGKGQDWEPCCLEEKRELPALQTWFSTGLSVSDNMEKSRKTFGKDFLASNLVRNVSLGKARARRRRRSKLRHYKGNWVRRWPGAELGVNGQRGRGRGCGQWLRVRWGLLVWWRGGTSTGLGLAWRWRRDLGQCRVPTECCRRSRRGGLRHRARLHPRHAR